MDIVFLRGDSWVGEYVDRGKRVPLFCSQQNTWTHTDIKMTMRYSS
jgi:hypothetical protein